jgi:tRNA(Ile)-lysidine synthase
MSTGPIDHAVSAALAAVGPGLYGVACSGGGDSMTLADSVIRNAGAANVVVLTIDHGLAEHSAAVSEAVAAWARERGSAAVIERVTVPSRASIEAAAREARYAALERLADELGLVAVFTAHTARDQAETVLMRVLRGTGPAGLAGIPARRGRFVRPFLALSREAIDAYVANHDLATWHDPMNDELRIARVRMRREQMPMLRRENPQLDAALLRLAAATSEWIAVIDQLAAPFARLPIECAAIAVEPVAIRKRALALALEDRGLDYDSSHLDAIDQLICAPTHGEVTLDIPGARVVRTYDRLDLVIGQPTQTLGVLVGPTGPYELRPWRPGDRMRPARLKGRSRKLSDLFIDAKVARSLRASARVVVRTTDNAIVWAEHIGIAHGETEIVVPTPPK